MKLTPETKAQKRIALRRELIDMKHYVQSRNKETLKYLTRNWKWSLKKCKRAWGSQAWEMLDPLYINDCLQDIPEYPDEWL